MGANNSISRTYIYERKLELALEKQRKIYENQTEKLLQSQREALAQEQQRSQLTNSIHYVPIPSATNSLYPNLPAPPNGNAFYLSAPLNNGSNTHSQGTSIPSIPTAPPMPINNLETQTSTKQPSIKKTTYTRGPLLYCPNHLHGCSLRFPAYQLTEHKDQCPFNDLICPMNILTSCSWKGKITHIQEHFKEAHPNQRKAVNTEDTLHISGNYQFVDLIALGAYNFLLHTIVDQQTKKISFGMQLMSSKVSAAKWDYEIRMYDKSQPRRLFNYSGNCNSNSEPLQSIIDEFVTIDLDYAKTFSHDGVITFRTFLRKNNYGVQPEKRVGNSRK